MYTLFIDDERVPANPYYGIAKPNWDGYNQKEMEALINVMGELPIIVVRDYDKMVQVVETMGTPRHVDFDHDLGEGLNGYDCARYFVGRYLDGLGFPETWAIHSQNHIGRANIERLMDNCRKFKEKEEAKERP